MEAIVQMYWYQFEYQNQKNCQKVYDTYDMCHRCGARNILNPLTVV